MSRRPTVLVLSVFLALIPLMVDAADRDLFDEAERRFLAGNYSLAIQQFESLLEEYPASQYGAQAQLRVAQSHFYLGNYQIALERLQRSAARARGGGLSETLQLWIGLSHFQLGSYGEAATAFTRYIEAADRPQGRAWLYRGLSFIELERLTEAQANLERALETTDQPERGYAAAVLMELAADRNAAEQVLLVFNAVPPEGPDAPYAEARLRYAADAARLAGDVELAQTLYRRLTGYSLDSVQWAYRQLYAFARDRQDTTAMEAVYREAERRLAGEPERLADFWYALGGDALARERPALAEVYLTRLWEVRQERSIEGVAALLYAQALEAQGRDQEALSILEESLDDPAVENDHLSQRRVMAARLHLREGRFQVAQALVDDPEVAESSAEALYTWAFAAHRAGDTASVLSRLERDDMAPLLRERPALLRLRGRVQLAAGSPVDAVRSYRSYLAERPGDTVARLELVRSLVSASQFPAATRELAELDDLGFTEDRRIEAHYLRAITAFHSEQYQQAIEELSSVPADGAYEPGRSYHLAWSLYRTGETAAARDTIAPWVDSLPVSLRVDGGYLFAWTLYRSGETAAAGEELLRVLGEPLSMDEEQQVRQLLATVYLEDGRFDDALFQYRRLVELSAGERSASYLQQVATTLAAAGRLDEAVQQYDEIADTQVATDAGRTALLEAGELLYSMGSLRQARERFRLYQSRYPRGAEIDRALYWAGLTSFDLGEAGRSLLWWEPLINEYPRSRFTPEVLFLTAEIYADRGERRRSLELYDRLVAAYPDSPRTVEADRRRRTLRLELDGLSAREAELWVALESATDTPEPGSAGWFDIVLELGRIAIREQITLTVQRSRIVEYLLRAGDYTGAEAAEASVLLAEYYRRRGETRAAVERYVQAAATPGAPDELRAQSLFELAVLARDRGDTTTARDAVRELSTRYPDSIWSDRAQSVLEDD